MVNPTEKLKNNDFVGITSMASKELLTNINKFINSAKLVYNSKDYTSATILWFKVCFSLLDFVLLTSVGKIPKDHNERFELLREYFPNEYIELNKLFKIYRDTYRMSIGKQKCDKVINFVKKLIKKFNIPANY